MLEPPPPPEAPDATVRPEQDPSPPEPLAVGEALERLLQRGAAAALQTANELRALVETLQLLLQRFQVQALRLESELARIRTEYAHLLREIERQQEAAWEARQQLEREHAQARRQVEEERAALRAAAEEEARCIRLAAEQEAAALLAAAQARRAELLAAGSRSRALCTPESSAADSPTAAPPASGTAPHAGDEPPAPAAGEPAGAERAAAAAAAQTEVVILRVPDARRAAALQAAIAALPGVRSCRLREFARGRLILDVEHHLGHALADRLRTLPAFDLRLISARDRSLELQLL
jgi:F-type H+-transporting ATPase subunit b